jgi:lysylphosphatidylglycerol synthetase-like protein (DUF2156 family)
MTVPASRIRGMLTLATGLAGLMNLFSALFPDFHWRFLLLRDMIPVSVINGSKMATVILGMVLILLADRLDKRQTRAMWMVFSVLLLSAVFHLVKGLDYEEATVCLVLACALFMRRREYTAPSTPLRLRSSLLTVAGLGTLFFAFDMLGFRILGEWIAPHPTLFGAVSEPVRYLVGTPVYHYHGPARWFGLSIMLVGSLSIVASILVVLRPFIPLHFLNHRDRDHAEDLIRTHGTDTLSYFALRDDRRYFFNSSRTAVVSYKVWHNVALVGGDPIGPHRQIRPLLREFLGFCRANGLHPAFVGTGCKHLAAYRAAGLRVLKIGEECSIRLGEFDSSSLKRKVRRAERHCLEHGYETRMVDARDITDEQRAQALAIARAWVQSKGGSERGFSMTLGRFPNPTDDVRVLLALNNDRLAGFLTFVPVYGSNGWSLDMMRRDPEVPNGMTEFMVIQAANLLKGEGSDFMSLNFASLSSTEIAPEPRILTTVRKFLFENLSSVYQLKSLYQFNEKFNPEWSSRYLVYGDLRRTPSIIMAVVQAEDPIKLSTLAAVLRR